MDNLKELFNKYDIEDLVYGCSTGNKWFGSGEIIESLSPVDGKLIGVDFMPAKDREKEKPFILEVNASPGFAGIQGTVKSKNVLKEIFTHFMNRDNWT